MKTSTLNIKLFWADGTPMKEDEKIPDSIQKAAVEAVLITQAERLKQKGE